MLWKQYNRSHITRIYPNGSRVDSSNFSPLLSWTLGCQMVSLNFQTTDSPLIINDGLFRQNGGCGYVLKSDELRDVHGTLSTQSTSTKTMRTIRIRVVSGSCLPKPDGKPNGECIDPYVRVRIHDLVEAVQCKHHKKWRCRIQWPIWCLFPLTKSQQSYSSSNNDAYHPVRSRQRLLPCVEGEFLGRIQGL